MKLFPQPLFSAAGPLVDIVTRTVGTGTGGYISRSVPTAHLAIPYELALSDRILLVETIAKLRSDIEFRIAYTNHILSGDEEDAWEQEAEQFVREAADLTPAEIGERLDVFRRLLPDWDLSIEEFADFWCVATDEVLAAVRADELAPPFLTYSNGSMTSWLNPQSLLLKGNE